MASHQRAEVVFSSMLVLREWRLNLSASLPAKNN